MIINKDHIIYAQHENIIGGDSYYQSIRMHEPTGVVFQMSILVHNDEVKFFTVGKLISSNELSEKQVFEAQTSEKFFEAVEYFEKLIEDATPQKKTPPPAMGKFVLRKGKDGIILIPGMKDVVVLREDLPAVFTPPKTKPYGRLDMNAVSRPEYEAVKSKFALNYNEEATLKCADSENVAVYDMTPYEAPSESNDDGSNKDAPAGVNEDKLTLDKIEGEDFSANKKGSNENTKDDGKSNTDKSEDKNQPENPDSSREKGAEDPKSGSEEGPEPANADGNNSEIGSGANVSANDLINLLNDAFETVDIVAKFRQQRRLMDSLGNWSEEELKALLYQKLGIPGSVTKQEFLTQVEEATKSYFQE